MAVLSNFVEIIISSLFTDSVSQDIPASHVRINIMLWAGSDVTEQIVPYINVVENS